MTSERAITFLTDDVVPPDDVRVAVVELAVAGGRELRVVVLQHVPHLRAQRQHLELAPDPVTLVNPATNRSNSETIVSCTGVSKQKLSYLVVNYHLLYEFWSNKGLSACVSQHMIFVHTSKLSRSCSELINFNSATSTRGRWIQGPVHTRYGAPCRRHHTNNRTHCCKRKCSQSLKQYQQICCYFSAISPWMSRLEILTTPSRAPRDCPPASATRGLCPAPPSSPRHTPSAPPQSQSENRIFPTEISPKITAGLTFTLEIKILRMKVLFPRDSQKCRAVKQQVWVLDKFNSAAGNKRNAITTHPLSLVVLTFDLDESRLVRPIKKLLSEEDRLHVLVHLAEQRPVRPLVALQRESSRRLSCVCRKYRP